MRLAKFTFLLGVLLLLNIQCSPKIKQETITFKGTIGNKFFFSRTDRFKKAERAKIDKGLGDMEKKMGKLDKYYHYLNLGKEKEAKEVLKSDSLLAKEPEMGLGFMYMFVKMKQLGILYRPLIQFHKMSGCLISITEQELVALDKYINNKVEVKLKIKKIGAIEMDHIQVYRLVKIYKHVDD